MSWFTSNQKKDAKTQIEATIIHKTIPDEKWKSLHKETNIWTRFAKHYPEIKELKKLECGAGGDCLFHVLGKGLNFYNEQKGIEQLEHFEIKQFGSGSDSICWASRKRKYTMQNMRDMTASQVNESTIKEFLISWDPIITKRLKLLPLTEQIAYIKKRIQTPGNSTWGEEGMLRYLLIRSPLFVNQNIGFGIVSTRLNPSENKIVAFIQYICLPSTQYIMFVFCANNVHFQLLGVDNQCVFHIRHLPKSLKTLSQQREIRVSSSIFKRYASK